MKLIFKKSIGIFLFFNLVFSIAAFADGGTTKSPESKEHKKLEAQAHGSLVNLIKTVAGAMKTANFLSDGSVQVNYSTTLRDQVTSQNLDLNVDTRMFAVNERDLDEEKEGSNCGGYDEKDCYAPAYLIMPIEVRVRADIGDIQDDRRLKDVRAGILRMVVNPIGVTGQLASYYLKNYDHGLGKVEGFEIASLTLNYALDLTKDGKVEIVFKGNVTAGVGQYRSKNVNLKSVANSVGERLPRSYGGFMGSGSGSVGLRIKKRILLDFFGGVNYLSDDQGYDGANPSSGADDFSGDLSFKNTYVGGGLRVKATKWLDFKLTQQFDRYDGKVSYTNGPSGSVKTEANSTYVGMILSW